MNLTLLFADGVTTIQLNGNPEQAPKADLESICGNLKAARTRLGALTIDNIIGLLDAAARDWSIRNSPVHEQLATFGIGFLPLWMRRENLQQICDLSCHGNRKAMDEFVPLSAQEGRLYRAQPRGLVVHWIAGNVAVLGMLSVLQGLLAKNANLIKAPTNFAGVLPCLLQHLANVSWTSPSGQTLSGRILTDAVAVVHARREDDSAARALSEMAQVRVAWGGRPAIEAIMNLPRRFGTEDIIFGPRVSFAIVGREMLSTRSAAFTIADSIARDVAANDQQGCNSPHTVFVEKGGVLSPAEFAGIMAEAMSGIAKRIPLTGVAPVDAMNVLTKRAEYDMRATVFASEDVGWTVLYADAETGLGEPCYLRTVYIRGVNNAVDVAAYCGLNTQTAGLGLDSQRLVAVAEELTAHGIDRCPMVGAMSLYEIPWDGVFPIDRMVRWVSVYSPCQTRST